MQSLFNLKRSCLIALAIAVCMVAFAGAASANSVTLSKTGGAPGPSSYSLSSTFIVTVFANLGPTGGGVDTVIVSLNYDSSQLTAVGCAEEPGPLLSTFPLPSFGQFVSTGVYSPLTPNCGAGSPADGGLQTVGLVLGVEQAFTGQGTAGISGTLTLGTIAFHAAADGTDTIASSLSGGGGFLGADFVNRTSGIPLGSLAVTSGTPPVCDVTIDINALRGGSPTVNVPGTKNITAKARIQKGTGPADQTLDNTSLIIEARDCGPLSPLDCLLDGATLVDTQISPDLLTLILGKGGQGDKLTMTVNQCVSGFIDFRATFTGTSSSNGGICTKTSRLLRKTCN